MRTPIESTDRRVRRSSRMLKEAFLELMREKGFSSITVQDIADKADMNRGTFYAHFPDKYALLESSIRDKFLKTLNRELPPAAGWNAAHLRLLIRCVLEHFKSMHGRCYPADTVNPLFEHVVQEELRALLAHWLREARADSAEWPVSADVLALMTSWGIFGAAVDWSRRNGGRTAEEMAEKVVEAIMDSGGLTEE